MGRPYGAINETESMCVVGKWADVATYGDGQGSKLMLGISSLVCSQVLDFFRGARPYRNIAEQPAIKLEGDVERDASAL